MPEPAGRALVAILEEAAPGAAAALAVRLGVGGLYARLTGTETRAPSARLWARTAGAALDQAARDLCAALVAAGVPHCVYKGAGLGAWYRPGERDAADVDLLIARPHRDRALAALAAAGFVESHGAWEDAPPSMRRGLALERPDPGPTSYVDLVWGLTPVNRLLSDCEDGALDALWSTVRQEDGLSVPPPGAHFALLVHHLVHHDLQHGVGVVDALLVWATLGPEDAEAAAALARRLRVARVAGGLSRAFAACCGDLGPRLPGGAGLARLLAPARLLRLADRTPETARLRVTWRRAWRRARLLDRRADAWRLLRDVAAPPRAYLAWRWPAARGYLGAWRRHVTRTLTKVMFDR